MLTTDDSERVMPAVPRRELVPELGRSLGAGLRELRRTQRIVAAPSPPVPHPDPTPPPEVGVCEALRLALADAPLVARLESLGLRVDFTVAGEENDFVAIELGSAGAPEVTIVADPDIARDFWAGRTSEASLIAGGRFRVRGELTEALRFLRALSPLSFAWCNAAGEEADGAARFAALAGFDAELWSAALPARRQTLADDPGDRGALAAVLLLGLAEECRRIELPLLLESYRSGRIAYEAMVSLLGIVRDMARPVEHDRGAALAAIEPRQVADFCGRPGEDAGRLLLRLFEVAALGVYLRAGRERLECEARALVESRAGVAGGSSQRKERGER